MSTDPPTTVRYWQDFQPGEVFESPARTVTEADIVNFTGLSWDFNPLHTDEESARRGPFGRRIAQGALGIAVATGLLSRVGHLQGSAIAMLGIDGWQFRKPLFAGDTVHVRVTIEGVRPSSKPGRGVVDRRVELVDQDGEVVQGGRVPVLVKGRPGE
jgi:acyl dehydratase